MSRPGFPQYTALPTNVIGCIREEQEYYDRDPEQAEREQEAVREEMRQEEERRRQEEEWYCEQRWLEEQQEASEFGA